MRNLILPLLAVTALSLQAAAQEQASPEAEAFFTKAMSQINPRHTAWVKKTAADMQANRFAADSARVRARNYAQPGNLPDADIEALVFLVLMQASKSAQEDLKAIMAQVKAINNAKAKQRQVMETLKQRQAAVASKRTGETGSNWPPKDFEKEIRRADSLNRLTGLKFAGQSRYTTPGTKAELDNMVDTMKRDLDSLNEMGEMESLRLQMAMDRLSKLMSTLSNIMKKISKTQDTIIQNLK
ncbi:MAG: hypothetical protein U0U70_09505 [Chitinophagaceae bacterium]